MTPRAASDSAPYACCGEAATAREHEEPGDRLRHPLALDRYRIIQCTAFRRLVGKTQVFAPSHHDHFRTRLTHTLEASQLARTLAEGLRANADLTETITLAHDLGHPPFGHAGEAALAEAMADAGGFNHNLHALRLVTYLEHPFPAFRGLNLTMATRDGLASHVSAYDVPAETVEGRVPSVEAQISSLADRIAYNCHDLEDAIGAGLVGPGDLGKLTLWREGCERSEVRASMERIHAIRRPVLDAMCDAVLLDAVATSATKLSAAWSPNQAGRAPGALVALSERMERAVGEVERFLRERVYRHPDVVAGDAEGKRMIHELFDAFRRDPGKLPDRFAVRVEYQGVDRVVCDYIAGMTDRFCAECRAKGV